VDQIPEREWSLKTESIVLTSMRREKRQRSNKIAHLILILFLVFPLVNCGGGGGSSTTPPTPPPPSPSPSISSLNPASVVAGVSAFTLTVNGQNFVSGSKVWVNNVERPTTFVSSQQLKADVAVSDIAVAGTVQIQVVNPAPNAGFSNISNLSVTNPLPILTSSTPASIAAGSAATTLVLNGQNFLSNSTVQFGASSPTPTFINSTRLTINLTASDLANSRSVAIHVTNPAPGGGTSSDITFNITSLGLSVITKSLPAASPGKQYSYTLQASGGKSPYSWSLSSGALPGGLNMDSLGGISGMASSVATDTHFGFTAKVTDAVSSVALQPLDILARSSKLGRNDVCGPSTASPISNGVIRASISPYGDVDVYSFQASAGASVSVEIRAQRLAIYTGSTTTDVFLDSFLEILDSNCNRIAYNDDIDPGVILDSAISNRVLPTAGTYYIRVSDLRGDGRPDFIYELNLSGAN
jgi:hypothetical protein